MKALTPEIVRRRDAETLLGGRQVLEDAMRAKLLAPCCQPSTKMTFFRYVEVQQVALRIAAGDYPGRQNLSTFRASVPKPTPGASRHKPDTRSRRAGQ